MLSFIVDFSNPVVIIDLVLGVIVFSLILVFLFKHIRRSVAYALFLIEAVTIIASYIFQLQLLLTVSSIFLVVFTILTLFINIGEVRQMLANPLKAKLPTFSHKTSIKADEHIIDYNKLYKSIYDAVVALSKSKTGALMTFQKKDPLNDIIKSGSILNAPVSSELLQTIFYPGTRLHDGAVVITGDKILAASVYYTPTTKPLTGKFGARHRAAIGISEISDSVTVIVSEETGRVSIAYGGELQSVTLDTFPRVFENYMGLEEIAERE